MHRRVLNTMSQSVTPRKLDVNISRKNKFSFRRDSTIRMFPNINYRLMNFFIVQRLV